MTDHKSDKDLPWTCSHGEESLQVAGMALSLNRWTCSWEVTTPPSESDIPEQKRGLVSRGTVMSLTQATFLMTLGPILPSAWSRPSTSGDGGSEACDFKSFPSKRPPTLGWAPAR